MQISKFHIIRNVVTVGTFVFCLTQLGGCSSIRSHCTDADGPPSKDIDESKIANAVPKVEPYHPYGTKDYVVRGHRYHVLKDHKGYAKTGTASWYGSKFDSKDTSTQERYNLYKVTAASTTLPLPCTVKVTNLENGKTIIARVNDRGPFIGGRLIDLSYAGAKKLGFVAAGIAKVKVEAIDAKAWLTSRHNNANPASEDKKIDDKPIYLQVGAFSQLANAKKISDQVSGIVDKPTKINHKDKLYRVCVGPIASTDQKDTLQKTLQAQGFDKVVVAS
jgi:rare lipoprotein A